METAKTSHKRAFIRRPAYRTGGGLQPTFQRYIFMGSLIGGPAMLLTTVTRAKSMHRIGLCLPLLVGFTLYAAPAPTAVVDAAKADSLSAVRRLINDRAEVNASASDGSSALLWAAYHSNLDMTKA